MIQWIYRPSRLACRIYFALWHRSKIVGRENVPSTGPVLLLANHASFLDPPLVGCVCGRDARFIARSTLGEGSLFGRFLHAVGVRFIDRDGSARAGLERAIDELSKGHAVFVFPEGRRTDDGRLGEIRAGFQIILRKVPVPVIPVGVRGTFKSWSRHQRFPRPHRCEVHFGQPMSAAEALGPDGLTLVRERIAALAGLDAESAKASTVAVRDTTSYSPGDHGGAGIHPSL
ncbi:MAG: lysophospholipid acyltransferase family protein [Planctomycetota bacterium]